MLEDMMLQVRRYSVLRVRNDHRARGDAVVQGALMLMHRANLVLSRGDKDCDLCDLSLLVSIMTILICTRLYVHLIDENQ